MPIELGLAVEDLLRIASNVCLHYSAVCGVIRLYHDAEYRQIEVSRISFNCQHGEQCSEVGHRVQTYYICSSI